MIKGRKPVGGASEMQTDVGRRLRMVREAYDKVSVEKVAAFVGADGETWRGYEIGRSFPNPVYLRKFCIITRVPTDFILIGLINDAMPRDVLAVLASRNPKEKEFAEVSLPAMEAVPELSL